MVLADIILELCGMDGPAGFEERVAGRAAELLAPYMDEVKTDILGNVIGVKRCGALDAVKVMIDAHIDEVGFVVTGIKEGFLSFAPLGGADARILPSSEMKILTEKPIYGVVACMPPHVLSGEKMDKAIPIEDMAIDIGMTQEQAERAVRPGTPVTFASKPVILNDRVIAGKALDNRACFATVLYSLHRMQSHKLAYDLYICASVQEEVGHRGAKAGAYYVSPDYCIALDVTHAHTPDAGKEKTVEFGGGPAIGIGPDMNRKLSKQLIAFSEKRKIPYQIEVLPKSSGTNLREIQVTKGGVATALLSLPLKYMHTSSETIKLSDAVATGDLLAEFLMEMGRLYA